MKAKVAVIGGGWAGIAAAVELTANGADTTLFEAGRVLGGRARSITIDNRQLDNGQHMLLGAYRDTLALMRRVGADPDALFDRRPLQVLDNDGFHLTQPKWPAPLNVAWGLFSAKGVSLGEKLKTAWWMEGIKRRRFRLAKDSTVTEWLDAAGQTGKLRRHLWEPLCLAALNTPAERASAQLFANVLRDSLGSPRQKDTDLLLPRTELGNLLPQPAACWLTEQGAKLRLGTRVEKLEPLIDGLAIDDEHFDFAILATAPQHAEKLWPELDINYSYEPIATAYLQFPPQTRLPFPLFNLLGGHGQWVIDRGNGLLACIMSGHGEWENLSDDALFAALHAELGMTKKATWQKIIHEKRATFCCHPGTKRPGAASSHPHLFIAGDYTWADYPATLEGAVLSGLRAARLALKAH